MDIANIPLPKGLRSNSPKRIVIHAMGEFIEYEGRHVHAYELLREIGLSAHRLLTPSGDMIKCREDNQGAYHAKGHNTDTLGIEILVPGVHSYASFIEAIKTPYMTSEQYRNLVYIVDSWKVKHNISKENIVRHSDIDPARKKDPGEGFPWEDFINELND